MANSLLDELREHLEGVENYWLYLALVILGLTAVAIVILTGVYFYTRR